MLHVSSYDVVHVDNILLGSSGNLVHTMDIYITLRCDITAETPLNYKYQEQLK